MELLDMASETATSSIVSRLASIDLRVRVKDGLLEGIEGTIVRRTPEMAGTRTLITLDQGVFLEIDSSKLEVVLPALRA
jgi:hypothetical protein